MFTATTVHYEIFNTLIPLVLQTVKIYSDAPQTGQVISLQNSAGTNLATATVNLVQGINTVTLNFTLPVATGLRLVGPASPGWYRSTAGFTYPITQAGKLSITGSSAGTTLRYYYFYDWVVKEADCVSPRVMVTASVNACTGIENNNDDASILIYPNPAENYLNLDINDHANEQALIEIFNLQGQKLYSNVAGNMPENFHTSIDISRFAKGVYMIRVQMGGKSILRKVEVF
jgi:hypothetical protein